MKNIMKSLSKTMLATAVAVSLSIPSAVNALEKSVTNTINKSIVDDFSQIVSSPAANKAYAKITQLLFQKLQVKPKGETQVPVVAFIQFAAKNQTLFAKWQVVATDFMQEAIQTMSVEDILAKIGLTTEMLQLPHTQQSAEAIALDDAAKDKVITQILNQSKNALTGILGSLGMCWTQVSAYVYAKAKPVESAQPTVEDPVLTALRKSLKKNLTLPQLEALHAFSKTAAFNIIANSFEDIKTIFIQTIQEEDQTIIEKLVNHLQAFQQDTAETDAFVALDGRLAGINITSSATV